jgi:hypothetical protein
MALATKTAARRAIAAALAVAVFALGATDAAAAKGPRAHASEQAPRVALAGNVAVSSASGDQRLKRSAQRPAAARRSVAAPAAPTAAASATPPNPATGYYFRGDQISDFSIAQAAPGAITEVPDPAGSGETVFKFTVSDNDGYPVTPTTDPRAELISPWFIEPGSDFWFTAKFFLPNEFPAAPPNFVNLLQVFGPPANGSPPFHIEASGGMLKWSRNAAHGWDVPWQMPEVRNQWVDVMVHERFATNGFVELWIDGRQVTFFEPGTYNPSHVAPTTRLEMATLEGSNNGGPNSVYLQQYRKKGMYPSLTVYQGPLTIGFSRQAVES